MARQRKEAMHSYRWEEVRHELGRSLVFEKIKLRWVAITTTLCLIGFAIFFTQGHFRNPPQLFVTDPHVADHRRRAESSVALETFEVSAPVVVPSPACQVTLMEYSFGNSYGHPFVASYSPPNCAFNRVVLNLTVTSIGRQFDRLAIMYLNDTEIWRTSTAEPTSTGIVWSYAKDVSNYLPLWKQQQAVIFDLGNIIDSTYTGLFNTVLTATFFTEHKSPAAADIIIPISAKKSSTGQGSAWSVPQQLASSAVTIPRNAIRAVFSVSACGQIDEEFWWTNVPSSATQTFPTNILLGYSPFREVQLLIDNQLVGVAWPFPVIFTGGVVPGFWRPVVGIDAFDLKEDEIDITPWIPMLSDGKEHTYQIRVVGINDYGPDNGVLVDVGSYWVVSGKLFLWLDRDDTITTGSPIIKNDYYPSFELSSQLGTDVKGMNVTLGYKVQVHRELSFSSTINTSNGSWLAAWSQNLSFSNTGNVSNDGFTQVNTQITHGVNLASSRFSRRFAYPLSVWSTVSITNGGNDMTIVATVDRSKNVEVVGPSVFPTGVESFDLNSTFQGAGYSTRQSGSAHYASLASSGTSKSWGETEQDYTLSGLHAGDEAFPDVPAVFSPKRLYARHVLAANDTIIQDSNPSFAGRVYTAGQAPLLVGAYDNSTHKLVAPPKASGLVGRHPRVQKRNAMYGNTAPQAFSQNQA